MPAWLAELGVDVPCELQACGAVYYARYYRLNPAAEVSLFGILGVREQIDGLALIGFPGDHGTYGLGAFVPDDDEELKVLRHHWAWDAAMAALPRTALWASKDVGVPLNDVQLMGGHQNVRRRYVIDGRPLVLGLLPVGDSLCTTNPMYGWGASMALTYAFAAVDAATGHPDDPVAMALTYDGAVAGEADAVFNESAAMDPAAATDGAARTSPSGTAPRWNARTSSCASPAERCATPCSVGLDVRGTRPVERLTPGSERAGGEIPATRPLDAVYPVVFIDAINVKIREARSGTGRSTWRSG